MSAFPCPARPRWSPTIVKCAGRPLAGPLEQTVRVAETIYVFGEGQSAQRYSVAVAAALEEVENSLLSFRTRLGLALALAGIGLLAVNLFQIRFGLLPLQQVEKGLERYPLGEAGRLEAALPQEIVPLQQELNALLKSNQDIVERARTHVGNLAHALKTPLAVIVNEARDDQSSFARKVSEQAEIMGTQIIALSRSCPHGRPDRRHRPGDGGASGRRIRSFGRSNAFIRKSSCPT